MSIRSQLRKFSSTEITKLQRAEANARATCADYTLAIWGQTANNRLIGLHLAPDQTRVGNVGAFVAPSTINGKNCLNCLPLQEIFYGLGEKRSSTKCYFLPFFDLAQLQKWVLIGNLRIPKKIQNLGRGFFFETHNGLRGFFFTFWPVGWGSGVRVAEDGELG